jgi:DNA-binding transcriptional LysR family regulator
MISPQPKPSSLQGVLHFVQAVEAGSFSAAAARLGLTASAVGKSIARMEQRLGARLMHRSTRRVSLTSDGEAYYRACVAALGEIDAIEARLAAGQRVPSGKLRIDVPLAFGRRCLAPILFEIAASYPELVLEVGFNDRRVDLIEEGIDLAVRMGELGDSAGLVARKLFVQRWTIPAAPRPAEDSG